MSHSTLPRDMLGFPIQALSPTSGLSAVGAVAGTSARVALPSDSAVIRVSATTNCYINFGNGSVAATASDAIFVTGVEIFRVPTGATHLAFLQVTAGGSLSVSRMD